MVDEDYVIKKYYLLSRSSYKTFSILWFFVLSEFVEHSQSGWVGGP